MSVKSHISFQFYPEPEYPKSPYQLPALPDVDDDENMIIISGNDKMAKKSPSKVFNYNREGDEENGAPKT